MKNTIFSIHKVFHYKGHTIVAEKRSLLYTMEYSLLIDGIKQDQIYGLYGILVLHGNIDVGGLKTPVKIVMKQRIFKTDFYCIINGEKHKMANLTYEGF